MARSSIAQHVLSVAVLGLIVTPLNGCGSGDVTSESASDAGSSGDDTTTGDPDTTFGPTTSGMTDTLTGGMTESEGGPTDGETDTVDPDPTDSGGECGDGEVNPGEECDEGVANADNGTCTSECKNAYCGDGHVQAGVEECDEGDNNSDNGACTLSCAAAYCGDGLTWEEMEQCDDGNNDNDDGCLEGCLISGCGDGFVGPGEACDDGNDIDGDGCNNCALPGCGDGIVENEEQCDDGNEDDFDYCGNCIAATCTDGIHNGGETDVDCGGPDCGPCQTNDMCNEGDDCIYGECTSGTCDLPKSCLDIIENNQHAPSGIYDIDPDGEHGPNSRLPVYCDMDHDGGGWTLVIVSSDDGVNTWTWQERYLMSNNESVLGDLNELHRDFKSYALHVVPFTDMMFHHFPSDVWAAYSGMTAGMSDAATFMAAIQEPVCDFDYEGYKQTAGTLVASGKMCDSNLYFHLGDIDGYNTLGPCQNLNSSWNTATYGPVWSFGHNGGCPFDDPNGGGLGPTNKCAQCGPNTDISESNGTGFGRHMGLNTGMPGTGENNIRMYVR